MPENGRSYRRTIHSPGSGRIASGRDGEEGEVLHSGHNEVEGIPVEVVRKRIRRINLRVAADCTVYLSVPKWWATLRQGEEFLREKWRWVKKTRAEVLARPLHHLQRRTRPCAPRTGRIRRRP